LPSAHSASLKITKPFSRSGKNAGEAIGIGVSDSPEEIEKKLRQAPDLFLLAESGSRIIGTVIGGYDGRRGMLYHLAVDAEFRGRGVGTLLMDEIETRLREKGCRKASQVHPHSSPVKHPHAIRPSHHLRPLVARRTPRPFRPGIG
jgi:GNAT superfamily N-acetyltransferase